MPLKTIFKFYFLQSIALMFIVDPLKHYRWGNVFLLHQIKEEHMNFNKLV